MSNYPAGVTDSHDHFDLPSVGDDEDHKCVDCDSPELDDDKPRCESCEEVQSFEEREERIRLSWEDYIERDGRPERDTRHSDYQAACRVRG